MIPAGLRRCGPTEPGLGGAAASVEPRHHPRSGGGSTVPSGLWMLPRECGPLSSSFLPCVSSSAPPDPSSSSSPSFLSPLFSSFFPACFLPSLLWSRLPSPQCRPWTGGGGGWGGGEGGSGSVPGLEAANGCRAGPAPRPPSPPPPRRRGGASVSGPPCPRGRRRRARRTRQRRRQERR